MIMLLDKLYERLPKSPSMDVLMYILSHTNPETKIFCDTYEMIQKDTKVSTATISRVFKILVEKDCLEKVNKGVWYNKMIDRPSDTYEGLDPYIIYKGP